MLADVVIADGTRESAVKRGALRDDVYDELLEMLLGGTFAPGQALGIDGVARTMGVSPSPVREALADLEHTGLVTRVPRKGYTVSPPPSAGQVRELLQARELLEVQAARWAVPVSNQVLEELRQSHSAHERAVRKVERAAASRKSPVPDWALMRQYYEADWGFHLVLLRSCNNRYLLEFARSLSPHMHRMRQQFRTGLLDAGQAYSEHGAILKAVETGEPDLAAEAMRAHIASVRERSLAEF